MTAISRIFGRRGSRGWMILAGESSFDRGLETSALGSIKRLMGTEGSMTVLAPGGKIPSSIQPFINYFEVQLGGSLKIIDPLDADPAIIQTTCQKAQLVLAVDGNREDWAAAFSEERMPADPDLIVNENSVFIATGSLVSVLGEWTYDADRDQISEGIGWFPDAIILLGPEAPATKKVVRQKIEAHMKSYAISIAPETIVGIGPQGQVEIWSEVAPEILLGKGWV